jgi:hypothetical protein
VSVTATASSVSFNGDGVADDFPLPFRVLEDDDLLVRTTDDDGVTYTTLVLDDDYTLADVGPDDGTGTAEEVTLTLTAGALAVGTELVVERNTDPTQETTYQPQGEFSPITVSRMSDKLTLIVQEQDRRLDSLEALADLVTVTALADGVVVEGLGITIDADAPEEEWPQAVAVAGGLLAKHLLLTRIYNFDDEDERLDGVGPVQWKPGPGANEVTLIYIPGLHPGKTYILNLLALF